MDTPNNKKKYIDIGSQINHKLLTVLMNHEDTRKIIDLALLEIQPKYREHIKSYFQNKTICKSLNNEEFNYLNKKVKAYILIILNYCFVISNSNKAATFLESFENFLPSKYAQIFKIFFQIEQNVEYDISAKTFFHNVDSIALYLDKYLNSVHLIIPTSLISLDYSSDFHINSQIAVLLSQNIKTKKLVNMAINTNLKDYKDILELCFGLKDGVFHSKEEISDNLGQNAQFINFLIEETSYELYRILEQCLINSPDTLESLYKIVSDNQNNKEITKFINIIKNTELNIPLKITIPNQSICISYDRYKRQSLETSINYLIKEFLKHDKTKRILEEFIETSFSTVRNPLKYALGLLDGNLHGYKELYKLYQKHLNIKECTLLINKNKKLLFKKISLLQVQMPDGTYLPFFEAFIDFLPKKDREIFKHIYYLDDNTEITTFDEQIYNQKERIMYTQLSRFIDSVEFAVPSNNHLQQNDNQSNQDLNLKKLNQCILTEEMIEHLNSGTFDDFDGDYKNIDEIIEYLISKGISKISISKFLQVTYLQIEASILRQEGKNFTIKNK